MVLSMSQVGTALHWGHQAAVAASFQPMAELTQGLAASLAEVTPALL